MNETKEWKINNWFMKTIFVINGVVAVYVFLAFLIGIITGLLAI